MLLPYKGVSPKLGQRVFIAPTAAVVGDVSLGDDASIWFNCVLRGDVNWIRIGARTNVQDMCCLHVTNGIAPLDIGDEVTIAHNVMLHGCTLRKGAMVGMSSTVMDGAEVGEGCLVAAGSLLREGFQAPPHTLVAGWPAVVKRDLAPQQRTFLASFWQRYVGYKDECLKEGW